VIRNLTRHAVVILRPEWEGGGRRLVPALVLPPEGLFVGLQSRDLGVREVARVGGVAVPIHDVGEVGTSPLPEPVPGVWLVVAKKIADRHPGRSDLVVPFQVVRDADGTVVGCMGLGRPAR
jgi:hypothetical protein